MKRSWLALGVYAAVIVGPGLWFLATRAQAQTPPGDYLGGTRCVKVIVQHKNGLACAPTSRPQAAGANHAYDRWNDGSTALSGSSAGGGFPSTFHGFSSVHDLGR